MAVLNAMSIAVTGMQAAAMRLEASASNVANVNTAGALPSSAASVGDRAYAPVRVMQSTLVLDGGVGGGTVASMRAVQQAYVESYEPTSRFANADGMIALPNVDLAQEVIDQVSAELAFKLNAKVFEASSDMLKTLIEMLDPSRDRGQRS